MDQREAILPRPLGWGWGWGWDSPLMHKYFSTALPISQERLRSWSTAALRRAASISGVVTKLMVTVLVLMDTYYHILTDIDKCYVLI